MIEVNKYNIDCEYINDYWKNNLIIDQSKQNISFENNLINDNLNKNPNRLTIDVNSYNEFKIFIDNLDELQDDTNNSDNKEYIKNKYTDQIEYTNQIEHINENQYTIQNEYTNENQYTNQTKYYNQTQYTNQTQYYNNIKEKLNNNYKAKLCINHNGFRKEYINSFGNSISDKSNITRTNSIYYFGDESNRKQVPNNRLYDKQKSSEYRVLQKSSYTGEDKGKMYKLPKKCRIHEYESRQRKILLDSFSKPKLIE